MPVFEYSAFDLKGKRISGIIDAESAISARQKLRNSQIFPVSINEESAISRKTGNEFLLHSIFRRIRASELAVMTRELSVLVGAGFPLAAALDTLVFQTRRQPLKKLLAKIKDLVIEGNSFSEALSRFPRVFSDFYINMVHAGETSGTLEAVLDQLAEMTEKQEELKGKIRIALTYPIFMVLLGTAVLFFLMTVIIPDIAKIFEDMGRNLPTPTRLLIIISSIFKSYWWLMLLISILILLSAYRFKATPSGRKYIDTTILKIPVMGSLIMKLAIIRLSRTLGSLLDNGVSMLPSLEIVKHVVGSIPVSEAITACEEDVSKGTDLTNALSARKIFPHLFLQMVRVGEQSARLEEMLKKIADMYEKDVSSQILRMTSLLEPIMILVMGLIIGFIVLSICLPIFEMNRLIV